MAPPSVHVRRVYDPPNRGDGYRVLVDRLWPRGIRKDEVHLDEWCKPAAPSAELRKWYAHDPKRFDEFRRRYVEEMQQREAAEAVDHLRQLSKRHTLTLVTATRDVPISGASVLAEVLRG